MIIVNFATGHYIKGQQRLMASIPEHYGKMPFTDYSQIGSPTHSQSPYEFKIYAIEKAFMKDDIVLWCDASMWRVGDMSKLESIIINQGWLATEAGHYVGRWTNQHTRNYFNLTEQELYQGTGGLIMFSAGLLGLNKKSELAMEFFKQWKASALAGCFRGSFEDHRHDQTCGSIIMQRLGMKYERGGELMSYIGPGYSAPEPGSVIYLQGI